MQYNQTIQRAVQSIGLSLVLCGMLMLLFMPFAQVSAFSYSSFSEQERNTDVEDGNNSGSFGSFNRSNNASDASIDSIRARIQSLLQKVDELRNTAKRLEQEDDEEEDADEDEDSDSTDDSSDVDEEAKEKCARLKNSNIRAAYVWSSFDLYESCLRGWKASHNTRTDNGPRWGRLHAPDASDAEDETSAPAEDNENMNSGGDEEDRSCRRLAERNFSYSTFFGSKDRLYEACMRGWKGTDIGDRPGFTANPEYGRQQVTEDTDGNESNAGDNARTCTHNGQTYQDGDTRQFTPTRTLYAGSTALELTYECRNGFWRFKSY